MNWWLLLEQLLNGLQYGLLLFLLAAGLTLVFGIMDMINLAHGSLYMMGAYFCATFTNWTGSFLFGAILALPATFILGVLLDHIALRHLYSRPHLDQVLATFGLVLFFNELVRLVWGPIGLDIALPTYFEGSFEILPGVPYPVYRLFIILMGCLVAACLYYFIQRTRLGMLVRAGASDRSMISALGVNISFLFTMVFGLGAALAGLAGLMAGPLLSVEVGMGDSILIVTLIVIVIGGIGSVRGAFLAAILVGIIDTVGRSFLPELLSLIIGSDNAQTLAPALSSMLVYILMILVLAIRPEGLFPQKSAQG